MHVSARLRVGLLVSGSCFVLVGCGATAREPATAAAVARSDVVRLLQVPENPYRIIYNPPVNLAKPPDTTAHTRTPRR
ncbi:MAG TPA: hypothetical protein VEU55_06235 [Gemmatimonadales bacterium]|nr:hypothetical protein [Gemmatimonadales bacterium]